MGADYTPRRGPSRRPKEKAPALTPGLKSLIAVITLRHLLREEKQGTTALRLSFAGHFSRVRTACNRSDQRRRDHPEQRGRRSAAARPPTSWPHPPCPLSRQPPAPPAPRCLHPRTGAREPPRGLRPDLPGVRARRAAAGPGRGLHARRAAPVSLDRLLPRGRGMRGAGHAGDGAVPGDRPGAEDARRPRSHQPRRPGAARGARAEDSAFPNSGC